MALEVPSLLLWIPKTSSELSQHRFSRTHHELPNTIHVVGKQLLVGIRAQVFTGLQWLPCCWPGFKIIFD
mgnify:CR=1 FL=1